MIDDENRICDTCLDGWISETDPSTLRAGDVAVYLWQPWLIPYSDLNDINLDSVRTMYLGFDDRHKRAFGDTGFGTPAAVE